MKVNLSRIHNMLKQNAADARACYSQASAPFLAGGLSFYFTIFESTTDADLKAFIDNVASRRQAAEKFFLLARQKVAYSAYLRHELDKANHKSGVAAKLLELNCLQQEIANLSRMLEVMAMSRSDDLEPLQAADYYKTSFTDKQRTYELNVKMFSVQDYEAILEERREKEKAVVAMKDEVALINQTTMVSVMSFEEFLEKQKPASAQ